MDMAAPAVPDRECQGALGVLEPGISSGGGGPASSNTSALGVSLIPDQQSQAGTGPVAELGFSQ